MEVNKEQAEKCRDLGAAALRQLDYTQATKMLQKSLSLFPLPGVEALLTHAKSKMESRDAARSASSSPMNGQSTSATSSAAHGRSGSAPGSSSARPTQTATNGTDGRAYTPEQVQIVRKVLASKEGGRGAHYRVLDIPSTAAEADIKKAYRKLSLKVHPDKNSAPQADEAFKAVGLAYATLSDPQKRTIYDRFGEEDPDNRGGSGGAGMRRHHRGGGGAEMSPEDIFNAFFGGMPGGPHGGNGGGGGVHFYSTGFGPGVQFRTGGMPRRPPQRANDPPSPGMGLLMQFLPVLFFIILSFMAQSDSPNAGSAARRMAGEDQYFSLTNKVPFTNAIYTKLNKVKDIPYFVTNKFLRTYYRDQYQLKQVEQMVERAYENYLVNECQRQQTYKNRLRQEAQNEPNAEQKAQMTRRALEFELGRCDELMQLFPEKHKPRANAR